MKWRSSLLLIRMEWSIRLSDELNRKHMEWAILCASGFSFWVDRTYVFPDIFFLGDRIYVFPDIIFWVDRTYVFPDVFFLVDRTYAFPDIIFLRWIELMRFQIFSFGGDRTYVCFQIFFLRAQFIYSRRWIGHKEHF